MKTVSYKAKTILVPLEGYLLLQKICYEQRAKNPTKEEWEKFEVDYAYDFNRHSYKEEDGKRYHAFASGDMGGSKNGRWTTWTVEDMSKMLDDAKIPYRYGERLQSDIYF